MDNSAVAALAQRLDALEKDVASLKTVSTPTDQTAATATLSQSLSDLKAKIAAGASYRAAQGVNFPSDSVGDEAEAIDRVGIRAQAE